MRLALTFLLAAQIAAQPLTANAQTASSRGQAAVQRFDVVVYGGTAGGAIAAVAAAREGGTVVVLVKAGSAAAVQDVDRPALTARLRSQRAVMEWLRPAAAVTP